MAAVYLVLPLMQMLELSTGSAAPVGGTATDVTRGSQAISRSEAAGDEGESPTEAQYGEQVTHLDRSGQQFRGLST